jgi:hypothetical protein
MRKLLSYAALVLITACADARAMSYGLISLPDGSTAVVAQGRIERNETGRLLSFLQAASGGGAPRTLILSSPGGDMVSALHLGETVRRLGLRTSVGSLAVDPSGQQVLTKGVCGSACVFALMGGVSRSMRPGSLIGVHSPQISVVSQGRSYVVDPATTRHLIRATEPVLRSYARQMGVSPSLISVAHGVPHHGARMLTPSEINRYGLVTGGAKRVYQRASARGDAASGKLRLSKQR